VMDVINHVRRTLRVDPKKIYITGLSLGGFGAWTTLGAYPEVFAGAIPICAGGNALSKACAIAAENVPVWGFHGDKDYIVSYTVTTKMVNAINACTPKPSPLAKATLFPGMGHIIWDKVYNETNALSWMLSFTNGTTTSTPPPTTTTNVAPVANAGSDQSIYLPTNVAYVKGSATDADGTISSYAWSQVSGPSTATLENRYTNSLKASNLKAGTYTFRIKATDNKGAYDNDDVKVVVNSTTTSTTSSPTVSAGSDKTLYLPSTATYITGTASDPDGIASWLWTKVSGPSVSITGATGQRIRVYNLVAGTYVFRLTVKDTKGNVKSDDMTLYVKGSTTASTSDDNEDALASSTPTTSTSSAPVVSAGNDQHLLLPKEATYITGSASDPDGIASWRWTKASGPSVGITGATGSRIRVYDLVAGTYVFRLTVKDTKGNTNSDDMTLYVKSSTTASAPLEISISTSSDNTASNDYSGNEVKDSLERTTAVEG
ncbi:MAG TPA: hypothetical protein VFT90_15640, partial [Chryseosolibacter sp.]|nr:hypothetical protein [Chryseosolibacter sp.]